jgi:hypothetical protein
MEDAGSEYSTARKSRFRFKAKSTRREDRDGASRSPGAPSEPATAAADDDRQRSRRHHRHRQHHRRKRKRSDEEEEEHIPTGLAPDAAFRESLFDALADDEGASYWEGVYGQPIHTYPRPGTANGDGDRGELEGMTDEEYAAYVRARMWEKTHEGLMEERERRRKAREEAKETRGRRAGEAETEREAFDRMVEESLRKGKERKTKRRDVDEWREAWKRYLDSWERLNELARGDAAPDDVSSGQPPQLRNLLVWPVKSGKRKDVTSDAVWDFMRNAPLSAAPTPADGDQAKATFPRSPDFLIALKAERVRWHPDKMQHRYGMLGMEDGLVKGVTEVFQILDRLWVEQRSKMGDS